MLAVLDLFSEDRLEWTSEEMMAQLGYSRPTLYRYLKTLRQNGMLASINNAGFTLGPKIVEMDFLLRRSDPLVLESKPILAEIAEKYKCTSYISRWYRTRVLCVENATASPVPEGSYPRGRLIPLGRGATSRAILAFLPNRQAEPLVTSCLDDFRSVEFGDSVEEVLLRLREIRKAGVAVAHGELTTNVIGFASPVFDSGRTPVASLSVTIGSARVDQDAIDAITADVKIAAARLSDRLAARKR
ncbi:MAG: IclR family transcriptional regulator [Rhizobiaceae bacterium]|nr:IclR family transcriptional regulator [Rhizobiaceae bacterium]